MTEKVMDIAYLGFASRGNLGDDAIELALRETLPRATFTALPLYPKDVASFLGSGQHRRTRHARLLLGGGTVIGRRNWRVHLNVGAQLVRSRPFHMLGAGVEDPRFQGLHSFSSGGELKKWRNLLGRFEAVTVRGPQSAELLADVGVEATIVGDPALLLSPDTSIAPTAGVIGLNLGFGDDLWGHDAERVSDVVAASLRRIIVEGRTLRVLIVNEADREYSERCVAKSGITDAEFVTTIETSRYFEAVSGCEVVLAERLHAGILAAAAGVPVVALEYQPKCFDFMSSIGCAEDSLRTDELNQDRIVDSIDRALDNREAKSHALLQQVGGLKAAQLRALGSLGTAAAGLRAA